jgi:pectin lyase
VSSFHTHLALKTSAKRDHRLKSWLADSTARVIILNKEYNFIGSAGTVTATGCRPASNTCPGNGGQDAINGANWCTNSDYPSVSVTYDAAALTPLEVKSNKSIVGIGSNGVIRGVGLRLSGGAENVIIQNVHITELNPQYIWGGDAITLVGTNKVWIDHCKVRQPGPSQLSFHGG